ncbi:hypothetical protein CYMTET_17793 [Cymbomonas tetramitiformis]|uniref:Thioredoxin-like fold domain-containing protein n=1 Tax=Cymbomonas tetramitiformis TaxID=36881 RepID=A0AAE0G972_9CHLO|nr:hypothetical protein CYMTET_17793 [Cymbomonas tetramitiformis]
MELSELLGDELLKQDARVSTDTLRGKLIGVWVSANTCETCTSQLPHVLQRYPDIQASGDDFEMVFLSDDETQADFDDHYGEMPWLAVPYEDRARISSFANTYQEPGYSFRFSLLIFNDKGELVTKAGEEVDLNAVLSAGKYVGLCFSFYENEACRAFVADLVKVYERLQEEEKPLEIIFVLTAGKGNGMEYDPELPFFALPFSQRERADRLREKVFELPGYLEFMMLSPELEVINRASRSRIVNDPEGKDFPWFMQGSPKALQYVADQKAAAEEAEGAKLQREREAAASWDTPPAERSEGERVPLLGCVNDEEYLAALRHCEDGGEKYYDNAFPPSREYFVGAQPMATGMRGDGTNSVDWDSLGWVRAS